MTPETRLYGSALVATMGEIRRRRGVLDTETLEDLHRLLEAAHEEACREEGDDRYLAIVHAAARTLALHYRARSRRLIRRSADRQADRQAADLLFMHSQWAYDNYMVVGFEDDDSPILRQTPRFETLHADPRHTNFDANRSILLSGLVRMPYALEGDGADHEMSA